MAEITSKDMCGSNNPESWAHIPSKFAMHHKPGSQHQTYDEKLAEIRKYFGESTSGACAFKQGYTQEMGINIQACDTPGVVGLKCASIYKGN